MVHQLTLITFFLHLSILLPHFFITAATDNNLLYNPTEHILLDCGSSSESFSLDSRHWDSDADTKFSPNINNANISLAATASEQDASFTDQVPYMTARIFLSHFSYNFPVSPGRKILRLYFYPATYSINLNKTQSFFGVTANHYTLLSNFSVFLSASVTKTASLVKEFDELPRSHQDNNKNKNNEDQVVNNASQNDSPSPPHALDGMAGPMTRLRKKMMKESLSKLIIQVHDKERTNATKVQPTCYNILQVLDLDSKGAN